MSAMPQPEYRADLSIANWPEIRQWAIRNDAVWHNVYAHAGKLGMSEQDEWILLAIALTEEKNAMAKELAALKQPQPLGK